MVVDAVVATGFGGPEVLDRVKEQLPAPGSGDVSIRVRAIGVNPIDYKLYSGVMGADPASLPLHLGQELAGVVTAVGDDAATPAGPLAVGQEVIAYRRGEPGAYATEVTWPAAVVMPKPDRLAAEHAAGLLLVGTTATHALAATEAGSDDVVLVHGASGSVGLLAAQLAAQRGARVIGTASEAHHDELRGDGVDPVTYGRGLADRVRAPAPAGVDVAIDTVGTDEAIDVSLELVTDRARIATVVAIARGNEAGIHTLGAAPGASDAGTDVRNQAWSSLITMATDGRLDLPIAATFPLRQAADAHRLLAGGHAGGKVILQP